jgi:hypothetical protein
MALASFALYDRPQHCSVYTELALKAPSTPPQYQPIQYRVAMTVVGIEWILNGFLEGFKRAFFGI